MDNFIEARERMIERQLKRRGINDPDLLAAMAKVEREAFIPEGLREFAYDDAPLPIGEGQTISQPFILAVMIQATGARKGERVLEIGAGSGYAAAVLAAMGARVFAIERHPSLASSAAERLAGLGYANAEVKQGDGTLGWAEKAPFDVILGSAGGPAIPQSWREQLAIGGRLVMPVGDSSRRQHLVKLTRKSATEFEEERLDEVMFVPLIGEQGWTEDEQAPSPSAAPVAASHALSKSLPELIRDAGEVLPDIDGPAFGSFFDRFGESKVVLLGEASHGTSEFYRARAAISRRLIEKHGFNIVALEADWPDAAMVDRYVRHRPPQKGSEPPFRRFPTWMWRNTAFEAFTEWLRTHNETLPPAQRTGVFGLDMYSLSSSIAAVVDYLDKIDPDAAQVARERYGCLTPWQKDPSVYGRAVLSGRHHECEGEVVAQLSDLLAKRLAYARNDGEAFLDAAQNALLVKSAERYYRIMYYGGAESWNLRDTHMFETLTNLLQARGPHAKAIVWAHNSHIGNAAATEMGRVRDETNVGQLCRERFGSEATLIGFGTHKGTVAAASDWDEPMEIKRVRPSREESYERLFHDTGLPRLMLDLRSMDAMLREKLMKPRIERFIGVIYRPETELLSHYAEATLPEQFDAFAWFDETTAVTPLPTAVRKGVGDTYPFGV